MKMIEPPQVFIRLLEWFCPEPLLESILGDLEEQFDHDLANTGKRKARLRFAWNVIRFLRPGILLRNRFSIHFNQIAMFKNYFKIAYRNLLRYKFFSFINIMGLSIGIAMSLFIFTHVINELSYETSFPKHEQIYRLASTRWAKKPPMLADKFKEAMPEVKNIGRLFSFSPTVISHKKNQILVDRAFIGDPAIIDIFDFKFLEGNPETALKDPNTIILTETMANKLFKTGDNRIGEVLLYNGDRQFTIVGIMEDLPKNSHLKIDCMMSSVETFVSTNTSQFWSGVSIYALFNSERDVRKVEAKLLDFEVQFFDGVATREETVENGDLMELHPITDIHLQSHREKETEPNSNMAFIYIFSSLAVFILLVVIINFVNLYVAQTLNRLKEIGLRKVMGAHRSQLIFQFLAEAFFLVLISGLLAVFLTYIFIPYYNNLAGVEIGVADLFSPKLLMILSGLIITVGLLAGGYPALYLSKFSIDEGLRTKLLKIGHKLPLRTSMVAFQFLISIFLLTATLIVSQQMSFVQTKNLGFAEEEIVAVKVHGDLYLQVRDNSERIRTELTKNADIEHVSVVSRLMGDRFGLEPFNLKNSTEDQSNFRYVYVDEWFSETMGLEMIKGGLEQKNFTGIKFLINEKAAIKLQEPDLVGKTAVNSFSETEGQISGIVENFNFASLHNQIEPLVMQVSLDKGRFANYLFIRIKSKDLKFTMAKIESTLNEIAPETLIISQFMDEKVDQLYRNETDMFAVFKIFSTTIIGLACLGLFALFAFVSQARTKELGIRKTLGASLTQLLVLMSKSYVGILTATIIISIPLSYYFSSDWLANFAFSITVQWWYFVVPGLIILCFAAMAIILQSWKVAVRNPVESLRDE